MRPKRNKPKAVTVAEVQSVVLHAIAGSFEGRTLDIDTARLGLANAAYDLSIAHIKAALELAIRDKSRTVFGRPIKKLVTHRVKK